MDLDEVRNAIAALIREKANIPEAATLAHFETPKETAFGDLSLPCFYLAKELHRNPAEPSSSALYRFGAHLETHGEWEEFIRGW